jgi:hypothetical protein
LLEGGPIVSRFLPSRGIRAVCLPLVLGLLPAGAAWSGQPNSAPPPGAGEVVISAQRFERHTLERELIPQFVKTRSVPTPAIEQLARWHDRVCPEVQGLPATYDEIVSRGIIGAAQAAGAPSAGVGKKCSGNITIIFTADPQQLVDSIAKEHSSLLGSGRRSGDTVFSHVMQVWYLTGTRQLNGGNNMPVNGMNSQGGKVSRPETAVMGMRVGGNVGQSGAAGLAPGVAPPESISNLTPDPAYGGGSAPGGLAGSRLSAGLRSELLHVLIIVDARKLKGMSLETVSDYIALLSLTRVGSLDACDRLPSILDLFAAACGERARPATLSEADSAFLQALYATTLDGKLGIEESEVQGRMMAALLTAQAH